MPRSSTERWSSPPYLLCLLAALRPAAAPAQMMPPRRLRLVDVIERHRSRGPGRPCGALQLLDALRHASAAQRRARKCASSWQPLGDCGVMPGTQISRRAAAALRRRATSSTAARVESDVPGQITLTFNFSKSERFVVAQGVDPRGLRLRLIDRARGRGKIMVGRAGRTGEQLRHQPRLATAGPSRPRRCSWRTSG